MFKLTSIEQKQAITTLKDELQNLKGDATSDTKFKRQESAAIVSAIWRDFKHQESKLEKLLNDLEDKLKTEELVTQQTSAFLIKKQKTLSDEVTVWEEKYNKDINEVDSEIYRVQSNCTVLNEKLHRLKLRKEKEIEDERIRLENEEKERIRIKNEKELLKRQNRACKTIVKFIRVYKKRMDDLAAIKAALKAKKLAAKKDKKKGKK